MEKTVQKRLQYRIKSSDYEVAEYYIRQQGLTPSEIMSIVFTQIAHSGKLPIQTEATEEEKAFAKILASSYTHPSELVDTPEKLDAFFNDDGELEDEI
ncbi:MAG: type II toxin-antitoxin system RelB/DinJ family antitoxin [Lachnospiraceae bacterium]|jgi:antitoxin component of RelBE/YafQ-DinJ toxin-antitoxin module|nr:type II toxin-antitoxin system RelB/DinJ family antitoxin [Lachnospiraceae bacterium]